MANGSLLREVIEYAPSQNKGHIYIMRPDGSGLRNLTPTAFNDFNPTWSQDGESIIFGSDRRSSILDSYFRLRLEDSELVALGDQFNQHVLNNPVDWSASGSWAVYREQQAGNAEIFRIRADGSEVVQLTSHPSDDLMPTWSPPMSLAWRGWINALAGIALLVVWVIGLARDDANQPCVSNWPRE